MYNIIYLLVTVQIESYRLNGLRYGVVHSDFTAMAALDIRHKMLVVSLSSELASERNLAIRHAA